MGCEYITVQHNTEARGVRHITGNLPPSALALFIAYDFTQSVAHPSRKRRARASVSLESEVQVQDGPEEHNLPYIFV